MNGQTNLVHCCTWEKFNLNNSQQISTGGVQYSCLAKKHLGMELNEIEGQDQKAFNVHISRLAPLYLSEGRFD